MAPRIDGVGRAPQYSPTEISPTDIPEEEETSNVTTDPAEPSALDVEGFIPLSTPTTPMDPAVAQTRRLTETNQANFMARNLADRLGAVAASPKGVRPEVRADVNAVIGSGATTDQRNQAYALVEADAAAFDAIIPELGPVEGPGTASAARLLRQNGIPTVADPRVISAIDAALPGPGANYQLSASEQREAYVHGQEYALSAGGFGPMGVDADALARRLPDVVPELRRAELLNSDTYQGLSAANQTRVMDAVTGPNADDPKVADNLGELIQNPNFQSLSAAQQTTLLSQAQNYPDSRSIRNLNRLTETEWFQNQGFGDQQRSAKLVAHLSQHDAGDPSVIRGTLDRILGPTAEFNVEWDDLTDINGSASGNTLKLDRGQVSADNLPVDPSDNKARHIIQTTTPHEVSHLVNGDRYDQTFEYLNEEYRAWYVAERADRGAPTNEQAANQWAFLLAGDNSYGNAAHGEERWFLIPDKDGALDKAEEAQKIFDTLGQLTGVDVTADNYEAILADTSTWTTNPNDTAPTDGFDGHDLNN